MTDTFNVKRREQTGTAQSRRLRKQNQTPAVLYGHGQEAVSIAIPTPDVNTAIRHGTHLVKLAGDLNENALIKEVQWDAFGAEVKHLDLTRVDLDERIEVQVVIQLHGAAPGVNNGGVLNQQERELVIACAASAIPEHLEANINSLEVGDELLAKEIELPAGAELVTDPEAVVVSCSAPVVVEETDEAEEGAASAEPEVIGRKEGDEEGGGE